jgi:predicted ATPase
MRELPSGTVTFLFTDIEGSTRLLHEFGHAYAEILAEHRRLLREILGSCGGVEVDTQGDAFFYAFAGAGSAVAAASRAQQALASGQVRVRIGLHTGEPLLTDEGYVGIDVHRAARIAACGHGGQVLLSEQTWRLLGDGATVRDLGRHRLKDLQEAEHIFQLGDGDFPPLKSLNQTNLPVQPTPFIGRERELAEVLAHARRDDVRLLTLTGAGGSGKTRLALQTAAELVDDHRDGVWFVSLASLADPQLLLATIARSMGLRETGSDTWAQSLAAHLRDKRLLLVVDNLEHLLPDVSPLIGRLLAAAPLIRMIVTSREPVRVAAEHEFPVSPLTADEAVTLFAERARAVVPSFVLTAENRATVEAICARLDRLPLAIELAVAWIRALPVEKLLTRLEQRLPLLTSGARDAPERQRTLRATIAWSFGLLTEVEQQVFSRLAVFAGGCTIDAAETVCDTELHVLAALVDKNLLRLDASGDGEPRYVMLETIREFAAERLTVRDDAASVEARHAEHFRDLSEQAEPELKGKNQRRWLARLELEHDNLRTALRWALSHGRPELALRMSAALWLFWYMHGHVSEARQWLTQALAAAPSVPSAARAKALDGAGYLTGEQGEGEAARRLMEESLTCARDVDSSSDIAIVAAHLCAYLPDEDIGRAEALGHEAVALAGQVGDRYTQAVALNNLGETARIRGDNALATTLYEDSYRIRRELGDASRLALSLSNLGEMALFAGDQQRARKLLTEALAIARGIGDKRHITIALGNLGFVELAQGHLDDAGRLFDDSLRLVQELGNRLYAHVCFFGLAAIAAARCQTERAARLAGSAEREKARVGSSPSVIDAHIHDAHLAAARHTGDEAQWSAAWNDGAAMTLDETIAYALATEED